MPPHSKTAHRPTETVGKKRSARFQAATDLLDWLKSDNIAYRDRSRFDSSSDYAAYRFLTGSVIRHRRKLLHLIETLAGRPVRKLDAEAIVCLMMGLSQLERGQRKDCHAVVYETVELLLHFRKEHLKSFVNANLRSYLRECRKYGDSVADQPLEVRTSHPEWMADRWRSQFGSEATRSICEANNWIPSVQIVINSRYAKIEVIEGMESQGFVLERQTTGGYRVVNPIGLFDTSYARMGAFLVQDESAQWIVKIVAPLPKRRVLDACAAPGGKLFHLEWKYGDAVERLVGWDLSPHRLQRLNENRARLKSRAEIVQMDATRPELSETFDLIIVDAPCTATGTIRKHPEIKWSRKPQDIRANRERQLKLLLGVAPYVERGGHIVYATCSLEREENQEVADLFLQKRFLEFERCPISAAGWEHGLITPEGHFQCLPSSDRMGAFAAVFRRRQRCDPDLSDAAGSSGTRSGCSTGKINVL